MAGTDERPSYRAMVGRLSTRLSAIRDALQPHARLPMIGAGAIMVIGLGTVALEATTEQPGPQWSGRLDEAGANGKAARLLGAAAAGLGAEVQRVENDHGGQLHALHDQVRALGEQHAGLVARLRSIERGSSAELIGFRDSLSALADRQTGIESKLTAATDLAVIKPQAPSLDDEVQVLRLVAAALLLREGAGSARPFRPALDRFASLAGRVDSASLEAELPPVMERIASLQPYAETGVVSARDLRRSFASLAALVERASPLGWWDSALIMLGWRDDPLQPLHEAQAALMLDDLEGAVASLVKLQGEPAVVTEGWLSLAQARLATDALVDDLYRLALAAGSDPVARSTVASSGGALPGLPVSRAPVPWRAAQATIPAGWLSR